MSEVQPRIKVFLDNEPVNAIAGTHYKYPIFLENVIAIIDTEGGDPLISTETCEPFTELPLSVLPVTRKVGAHVICIEKAS